MANYDATGYGSTDYGVIDYDTTVTKQTMIEKIKLEINKMKSMDKDRRWDYFKTYYLKISIAVIVGFVMLCWFIADTAFQKNGACMGCAYGVELTDAQKEALTTGYLEYYGYNLRKNRAALATDNMFEGTDQQMDANSHEMALFAQIAAGEIYYLILDEDTLHLWANGGIYLTLDEALSPDTVAMIGDAAVDVKNYDSDDMYPTAIDLGRVGFLDDDQEGYLVFTIAQPDDFPERLINYLYEIQ